MSLWFDFVDTLEPPHCTAHLEDPLQIGQVQQCRVQHNLSLMAMGYVNINANRQQTDAHAPTSVKRVTSGLLLKGYCSCHSNAWTIWKLRLDHV